MGNYFFPNPFSVGVTRTKLHNCQVECPSVQRQLQLLVAWREKRGELPWEI